MSEPAADEVDVTDRSIYHRTPGIEHDPSEGPRRFRDDRGREVAPDLLALMGETPLVAPRPPVGATCPPTLIAKLEMLNPGGSVKDRIGIAMIEAAEAAGVLRPGGTIVEPTSGNTGVGLAIAASLKGYRCVFVVPDKVSADKVSLMRAYGAEVVVCPTAVEPEDPRSYYSVSDRLASQPRHFKPNQYFNQSNPQTHVFSTGPELWRQTNGTIDAFVCGVGTGGTATGVGRYLKERNPDAHGGRRRPGGLAVLRRRGPPLPGRGHRRGLLAADLRPVGGRRLVTGVGRRVLRDGPALHPRGGDPRRRVLRHRAVGRAALRRGPSPRTPPSSCCCPTRGAATSPSSTTRRGWPSTASSTGPTARCADALHGKRGDLPALVHVHPSETVSQAIALLQEFGVSQMPVFREDVHDDATLDDVLGSIRENALLDAALRDASVMTRPVGEVMQDPLPTVAPGLSVEDVFTALGSGTTAVVVVEDDRPVGVLTRADLLAYLAGTR